MSVSYRQPGVVLTDRRFTVPLDHAHPTGETIELFAREVVAGDKAHQGPSLAGLPPGRPRLRREPFRRQERLARPRAQGVPGPAAGPARHRALHARQPPDAPAAWRPRRTGRLPHALPLRRDRPRLRADPPGGHRRRPLDRPRPELRRLLHGQLSVHRPRGADRRRHHRRAAVPRRARRRRLPGRLPAHRAQGRRALRPLPAGRRARPPHRRPPPRPRRRPAQRLPADRRGLPVARHPPRRQRGQPPAALPPGGRLRPHPRRDGPLRRVPGGGPGPAVVRRASAVRARPRGDLRPGHPAHRLGRRAGARRVPAVRRGEDARR